MPDSKDSRAALADELLSCPFCGKPPQSYWQGGCEADDCGYWAVECCGIFIHEDSENDCAKRWNTRSPSLYSGAAGEARWELHRQPKDQISDHKFSIWCDGDIVVLANPVPGEEGVLATIVDALNKAPTLPRGAERETIARIIAPQTWAQYDKRVAFLGRAEMEPDVRERCIEHELGFCQNSLSKADAILTLPSIPPREGPLQSTTERLVTARFEDVSCQQLSQCGWPECDCPRKDHVPKASTACPICGADTPHYHAPERERCSGCMIETCEDCFDQDAIRSLQSTTEQADASRDHPVREALEAVYRSGKESARRRESKWGDVVIAGSAWDDVVIALSPSPTSVMPDEGKAE